MVLSCHVPQARVEALKHQANKELQEWKAQASPEELAPVQDVTELSTNDALLARLAQVFGGLPFRDGKPLLLHFACSFRGRVPLGPQS